MNNLKDAFESLNSFHSEYKKSLHKTTLPLSTCKSSFRFSYSPQQPLSPFSPLNKSNLGFPTPYETYSKQNIFLTQTPNNMGFQFTQSTPLKQEDQDFIKDLNTIFRAQREQARIQIESMQEEDLYIRLGLNVDASEEEINKKYKKLCLKHHPDKVGGSAEMFHKINQAYKILSNKELRELYDQYGYEYIKDYFASFY